MKHIIITLFFVAMLVFSYYAATSVVSYKLSDRPTYFKYKDKISIPQNEVKLRGYTVNPDLNYYLNYELEEWYTRNGWFDYKVKVDTVNKWVSEKKP